MKPVHVFGNHVLSISCFSCGNWLHQGYARCPWCQRLRPEFVNYSVVVRANRVPCKFSGAESDVQLPNGDGIWPPFFLDFLTAGWLSEDLQYTENFHVANGCFLETANIMG